MATKTKVLVTDKLDQVGLEILKQGSELDYKPGISAEDLKKIIGDYDALLVRSQTQATKEILEAATKLKIIGRAGVGVDNIDVETATERGIIVVNSPEGNTIAAAEHTVALMMSLARQIPIADKSCKENKWERSNFVGTELSGHILGVVGLGKIGQRVIKVAQALGMKVLGYDPFVSQEKAEELGVKKVELEEIFIQSDYITLHVPKTKETMNMISKDSISKMKDGVRIINCARGGLINEADLAEAINSGKVAGAAIDVYETEPCTDSPLHKCGDKIVLTPHLGASTSQAQINVAVDVAEQIRDVLSGGVAKSAVNLPGLKPELVKHIKHYLGLAEFMGSMLRQIAAGVTKEIEISALGKLSEKNIDGLKLAILKGILSVNLDGVSFVNAPMLAADRKIKVTESKSEESGAYKDKLMIKLVTDKETKIIAGTILQSKIPAIVQIDNYDVNIRPENHSIITFHKDKPGVVAQVSKILWDAEINISGMNLGRDKDFSAVMVISVDGNVNDSELKKIEGIDGINIAKYVQLKGSI